MAKTGPFNGISRAMGLFSTVGSLIGGSSVKKGLSKAAAAQAGSSASQSAALETALAQALDGYSDYTTLGSNAAGAFADLLGIGGTQASRTSGAVDWNAYLANNPDVAADWSKNVNKTQFPTAEAYAKWHYDNYGRGEGRQVYETGGTETPGVSASDAQASAIAALKESPLFKTLFDTGEEAILANASATGGLRGGNTQRSLADFGSDTLSKVIQQQLANYSSAIGTGLNAQGAVTNANYNTVTGQNTAQQTSTDALIQKILGKAGVNSQNWNNIGSFLDDGAKTIAGLF